MGASTRVRLCVASSRPRDCVSKGEEEDVSMMIVPVGFQHVGGVWSEGWSTYRV